MERTREGIGVRLSPANMRTGMTNDGRSGLMLKVTVWAAAAAAMVAGAAAADEKRLGADEITALLAGNTMIEENPPRGGGSVSVTWSTGGRISAKTADGYSDTGTWWVDGDRYCRRWNTWADRKTTCWTLTLDGRTLSWYTENGEKQGSGELQR